MEIPPFIYTKHRREFGRPLRLSKVEANILLDITGLNQKNKEDSDRENSFEDEENSEENSPGGFGCDTGMIEWTVEKYANKEVQATPSYSSHEVNTEAISLNTTAINHIQGGYPREVDSTDAEHTGRYRKKIERDPQYLASVKNQIDYTEPALNYNNAINLVTPYFNDKRVTDVSTSMNETVKGRSNASTSTSSATAVGDSSSQSGTGSDHQVLKTIAVFRDPCSFRRPARTLSWAQESSNRLPTKFCVSYGGLAYDARTSLTSNDAITSNDGITVDPNSSFIWDILYTTAPDFELKSPSLNTHMTEMRYTSKDSHIVLGGCFNGLLALWDVRKSHAPCSVSLIEESHKEAVSSIGWIKSKSNTEFASAGLDGRILWWDHRNLAKPLEEMELILPQPVNPASATGSDVFVVGASVINCDPAIGLTKFTVGSTSGHIFGCNKKGKTNLEKIGNNISQGHHSAVNCLLRNQFYPKYFITTGDWTLKLWCDDIKTPLCSTESRPGEVAAACWSPVKPSVIFSANGTGTVSVYDMLMGGLRAPISECKISASPLLGCEIEATGRILGVTSAAGSVAVMKVDDTLAAPASTQVSYEKVQLQAVLERELKREKLLDLKAKELRIKEAKEANKKHEATTGELSKEAKEIITSAEQEFLEGVEDFMC